MQELALDVKLDDVDGSLGHRVYTVLRNHILDLSLPPSLVLPKAVLCEELGVSRSPVSEAMSRLSSEGLVDIIPQSATRVSPMSISELAEQNFLREAVEGAAAAKVATDHSEEQLTRLSRNLRLQGLLLEDKDYQGFFDVDVEFHDLILEFTGYPKVSEAVGLLSLQLVRARKLLLPEEGRPEEALAEHHQILDAIKDGDPESARNNMTAHLRQLIDRIAPLEKKHPEFFRKTH